MTKAPRFSTSVVIEERTRWQGLLSCLPGKLIQAKERVRSNKEWRALSEGKSSLRIMNTVGDHTTAAALEEVAEHPFLKGLNEDQLDALASCAMRVHYSPGELIFREGDPANRFYLLIKGKVALETEANEKRVAIQTIGGGDVLGWSWLFPPYYTHFDARAMEATEAMFFYGTRLRDMCDADHSLGYEMLTRIAKVVIDRLVSTQKRLSAASGA